MDHLYEAIVFPSRVIIRDNIPAINKITEVAEESMYLIFPGEDVLQWATNFAVEAEMPKSQKIVRRESNAII